MPFRFFTIAAVLLALVLLAARAEEPRPFQLPHGWDTLRCGLAIADFDNYSEVQMILVQRGSNGVILTTRPPGKLPVQRTLDEDQFAAWLRDIGQLFAGATPSFKLDQDRPAPRFAMLLVVETGFLRDSYYKEIDRDEVGNFTARFSTPD